MNHIYMLGLITNRGMRERFLHFFREYHIEVTFAALGRGTAGSALLDYLGMEDTEKAVYFAVITRDTWQELRTGYCLSDPAEQRGRQEGPAVSYGGSED